MSTRVILGGAGAIVGGIIGGPQGAAWGWAIGSSVGNVVDPQVIKGPSLGDLAEQTSQEGGPIPIIFGMSPPIAGNVIATSQPRIVKKKSGGKGGPKVETETVYRTYAIGVCEGPIGGFLRVWRNGKKVYDALDPNFTKEQLSAVAGRLPSRNEKFLENARFFLGTYDQNASPDLEAVFGAGTTPSYRGLAYMVIADEDVTDMRGMIPQWTVQVGSYGSHYESPVLWPWLSGAVADPRHPLNEYSYTFSASGAEGGPDEGSTGGTNNCSGKGSSIFGLGTFTSLQEAITALNAAWSSQVGARVYSDIPFAYSSSGNVNLNGRFSAPPTVDVGTPGAVASAYQRWVWLHHAIEGLEPNLKCNSTAGASNTAITNAATGTLIHVSSGGAVWDNWPRSFVILKDQGTIDGVYQIGVRPITGAWGPTCSTGDSSAYCAAVVRAERLPGAPTSNARKTSGTFRVLRAFVNTAGAGTGDPQAMPVGPCLDSTDQFYDSQLFWTDAYNRAVIAESMPAGLAYGVDYPQTISTAYSVPGPANTYVVPLTIGNMYVNGPDVQFLMPWCTDVRWSVVDGALPAGCSLDAKTGVLTGTALAAGSYAFTISGTGKQANGVPVTRTQAYSGNIISAPVVKYYGNQSWADTTNPIQVDISGTGYEPGDLLLVLIRRGSTSPQGTITASPSGGTLSSRIDGANSYGWLWAKKADGTEGAALNFTFNNVNSPGGLARNVFLFVIKAGTWNESGTLGPAGTALAYASANGGGGTAKNPPNLSPSWGSTSRHTLWISTIWYNNAASVNMPFPDHRMQNNISVSPTNNYNAAVCTMIDNVASKDPANYTGGGNAAWTALTIGISPP